MGLGTIAWLVGLIVAMVSLICLLPAGAALWYAEPWRPFVDAAVVGLYFGGLLLFSFRRSEKVLDHRRAFLGVKSSRC